jgi:hypothetical protein
MQGGCPLLTKNHRQEALARAYIQAIASRAGMNSSLRSFDYGIDVTLHDIWRRGRRYHESGYKIDIQAKSTIAATLTVTAVQYDLEIKNYDDLRLAPAGSPRLLVVLVLPDKEAEWTTQTEEQLVIHRAAYWLSLVGRGPVSNSRMFRVVMPRENLFTVDALRGLIQRLRKGEPI